MIFFSQHFEILEKIPIFGGNYNFDQKYVSNVVNLQSTYSTREKARFRIYTRKKDWSPTIYTVSSKKIETSKKAIKSKTRYTIQVASWPNLDQAVKDKEKLISDGYDAYIEKYTNEEKNIVRWRVRIGNFEDKNLTSKIKKELSSKRGKDIWIDKIK